MSLRHPNSHDNDMIPNNMIDLFGLTKNPLLDSQFLDSQFLDNTSLDGMSDLLAALGIEESPTDTSAVPLFTPDLSSSNGSHFDMSIFDKLEHYSPMDDAMPNFLQNDDPFSDRMMTQPLPDSLSTMHHSIRDSIETTDRVSDIEGLDIEECLRHFSEHQVSKSREVLFNQDVGWVGESDFLMQKLGGFRNIGWTLEHRESENGQTEYQALVYSLHTFNSYASIWNVDKDAALKSALSKCYEAEKGEYDNSPAMQSLISAETPTMNELLSLTSTDSPQRRSHESLPQPVSGGVDTNVAVQDGGMSSTTPCDTPSSDSKNTRVLVWTSCLPDPKTMTSEMIVNIWRSILSPSTRLISVLRSPIPSQGLLVFDDLPSAIDFIRTVKSKQLEFFDLLVAGELSAGSPSRAYDDLLFDPRTGDAVGFSLLNVDPQHPTCLHTLLRLSQKDAVALGHKRTSTETLRLLLTHPEVSPMMMVPTTQPYGPFAVGRTTPLSQTPSHRRASIWCALCCTRTTDIPGAWKHLSRNPHEALRDARNNSFLEWVKTEHPDLCSSLMIAKLTNEESNRKDATTGRSKDSRAQVKRLEAKTMLSKKANTVAVKQASKSAADLRSNGLRCKKTSDNSKMQKELNPEASPFVPCNSPFTPKSSPLTPKKSPTHVDENGETFASYLSTADPASLISINEALLLQEWILKQELSPRQASPLSKLLLQSNQNQRTSFHHIFHNS